MKNFKKNGIILILITLVVLYFVLKDDFTNITTLLATANFLWIAVSLIAVFAYIFFESLGFFQIIKSYNIKYSLSKCFKLFIMTKFFNGITPFSSGGQPMQVYLMKKDGIRVTKATNIIMQNFIVYQLALVTYGVFAILCNRFLHIFDKVVVLRTLVLLGFIINTFVMIILFVVSFSNRFNKFVTGTVIDFLYKIHIVKDKNLEKEKWEERCNDFHEGAVFLRQHKLLCFKSYIYNLIAMTCYYVIPLFVILALKNHSLSIIDAIVSSAYVMIIGSFVPIPGASGGIEYGFMKFFGNFLNGGILSATLLIWRFATYYIPMIIGAVLFNFRKEETK